MRGVQLEAKHKLSESKLFPDLEILQLADYFFIISTNLLRYCASLLTCILNLANCNLMRFFDVISRNVNGVKQCNCAL